MPMPERSDIDALSSKEGACVSILVPTHRAGREVQQAKIRLKNLLRQAEERLAGERVNRHEIQAILEPGHDLLGDEGRWRALEDSLAVYLAPRFSRHFTLPAPMAETLVTGRRFYLLPLLPLLDRRGDFWILALSLKSVRLFLADRFRVEEVELPGVPKRLTDVVGTDFEEDAAQLHTVRPGSGGAIVHGHGIGQGEDEKEETARFSHRVDDGIQRIVLARGNGDRPLVVAAAEPLASIYLAASHYAHLMPAVVAGNPELLSAEDLRARAWTIIEARLDAERDAELGRCRELLGTGRASTDVSEIVTAAFDGRVDTMFVADGARQWGRYDPATRRAALLDEPSGAEELLNLAATSTVQSSGKVRTAPAGSLPEGALAAAIFRY
jgi:hypothetical protein